MFRTSFAPLQGPIICSEVCIPPCLSEAFVRHTDSKPQEYKNIRTWVREEEIHFEIIYYKCMADGQTQTFRQDEKMSADPEDLNYDCTFNLFLARAYLPKLKSAQDRQKAHRWLRKLTDTCDKSLEEMKMRNDVLCELVNSIKRGNLDPPFDENPPISSLENIIHLLPGGSRLDVTQGGGGLWTAAYQKPTSYRDQPEEENFLIPSPLPKVGAYCYIAVVSSKSDEEDDD